MKTLRLITFGLALLLLTSCNTNSTSSNNKSPLVLTLEVPQKEFHSFDEVQFEVYLANQSDSSFLVHRRLFYLPFPAPSSAIEMLILISDSFGNPVANETLSPNYDFPSVESLMVIRPGEQMKKIVYLDTVGFYAKMFDYGEKYTVVFVYQNELDITKPIKGANVSSWVGTIRSNEETFIILPTE